MPRKRRINEDKIDWKKSARHSLLSLGGRQRYRDEKV